MRKRHLFAIICIIFMVAVIVYYIAVVDMVESVSVERDFRPSFIAKGVKTTIINADGQADTVVRAGKIEYFKVNDTMMFDHPYVYKVLPNEKINRWQILADKGYFNANEFFSLSGHVVINGLVLPQGENSEISDPDAKWIVKTSYLQLDLNSHDVSSDKTVYITGSMGTSNQGKELQGNLDTKIFNLKRECNAVLYPQDFGDSN